MVITAASVGAVAAAGTGGGGGGAAAAGAAGGVVGSRAVGAATASAAAGAVVSVGGGGVAAGAAAAGIAGFRAARLWRRGGPPKANHEARGLNFDVYPSLSPSQHRILLLVLGECNAEAGPASCSSRAYCLHIGPL